jgi:deglycase
MWAIGETYHGRGKIMATLSGKRVAVLVTDGFEEAELTEPAKALGEEGAKLDIIAPHTGRLQAFKHHDKSITVPVDVTLDEANPENYDALLLPGGALNADVMRANAKTQQFIRAIADSGKPMAVICHAPWELISAGVARGHTMTGYYTIQDDIRNAGAHWVDREVVVDGSLVTSRRPSDIPAFNREMVKAFAQTKGRR